MEYTNSQKLAAVLNVWMQPIVQQLAGSRLSGMPFLSAVENKIRSTGWVRPSWSIASELSPFIQSITGPMVEPLLDSYLSKIPDSAIPQMAHAIVDKAIENNGLTLFDGNVTFERSDLEQLKRLTYRTLRIVIGMVNDKDIGGVLAMLPREATYYFTRASVKRALPEQELARLAREAGLRGECYPDVPAAVRAAQKESLPEDFIFVGGSNFIVADLLAHRDALNLD